MPVIGVIELAFDPYVQLGELAIRWQTIGLTAAIVVGLGFVALVDGYLGGDGRERAPTTAEPALERPTPERPTLERPTPEAAGRTSSSPGARLRLDDLGYIVLGAVPGAVIGGRLVHGLSLWEAYAANPLSLFDPAVGTLSLLGAVIGGAISAAYVARVVGAPIRRWADAAALPLLLTLALGKLAQLLGGSGQGAPWDGPWAIAFVGAGPWISPSPEVAAHPAQVYEALWVFGGLPLLVRWLGPRRATESPVGSVFTRLRERERGGRLFGAAIGWFVLGRFVVGFSWRDDATLGPLNAEQAVSLVVLVGGAIGAFLLRGSIVGRDTAMKPREPAP